MAKRLLITSLVNENISSKNMMGQKRLPYSISLFKSSFSPSVNDVLATILDLSKPLIVASVAVGIVKPCLFLHFTCFHYRVLDIKALESMKAIYIIHSLIGLIGLSMIALYFFPSSPIILSYGYFVLIFMATICSCFFLCLGFAKHLCGTSE